LAVTALRGTDIMFRFFPGTEAVTTHVRAFPFAGISDLRMRVVPRELGGPRRAPTSNLAVTALWGMDIMFRFFPGTEAVTTHVRAFPFAGISDLRIRVVPRELGGPRGAPTSNAMTRCVRTRTKAITRGLLFRSEALTTLLLAIWYSHEPDASADTTPTSANGRYWPSILGHTMVYGSG